MTIQIEGIVSNALPPIYGTNEYGEWYQQDFIVETREDGKDGKTYTQKIRVTCKRRDRCTTIAESIGNKVVLSCNLYATENKGVYYNNVLVWAARIG